MQTIIRIFKMYMQTYVYLSVCTIVYDSSFKISKQGQVPADALDAYCDFRMNDFYRSTCLC